MTLRRIALLTVLSALAALGLTGIASAAPIWNLDVHHNETNFPPGGTGQLWFDVNNVGTTDSSGEITLSVTLPKGLTRKKVVEDHGETLPLKWSCPGSAGEASFTCTTSDLVPRHRLTRKLILVVNVAEGAADPRTVAAKLKGGGASNEAKDKELIHVSSQPAGFGIPPETFVPDFFRLDGFTPERESGAHPDLATFPFDLNSISREDDGQAFDEQKVEAETIRDLRVDLPPGFVGAPTAIGECSPAVFTFGNCPPSSQVGRFDAVLYAISSAVPFYALTAPVYNLSHPRGVITDLAFSFVGNPVHIKASLDPANHYAITTSVDSINETLPAFHQMLTVWGVPADHSHDSERCGLVGGGETNKECSTDAEPKPFLSIPSQCESDNVMRLHHYDSWQNTGVFGPEIDYTLQSPVTHEVERMTDCDKPRFEPEVEIEPTGKQANTPTGLDVHVKIAQNENPNALATPPVKRFTVKLPEGMSFSPSFADGLQSCSLAQMKLGTNEAIECPDASRIGEVTLSTPLLPKAAEGSMYLAAQGDNPFGSLFALYLVLHDTEERGTLIKIPGKIEVDPGTGQITTVFNDTPQFPFDDLTLKFRSGPRAPLVSPPTCGTQTIGVEVASYAQPQNPIDASNTYQVTEGPNGTPCPPDSARRTFAPKFSGGTLNPVAGSYSPFLFRLSREDNEQELSQVTTILPPGLVAKIAGVPACPDQAITSISTAEGTGINELNRPACPAASQIGTISAGLGAGPGPNYFPGKVYLAGPYKGAPLSLAVVAPAMAGPFDVGNVVVRAALYVDPDSTQVKAVSDPFPTILHGVILRVRDVRLRVDRPQTTINPTNCSPMSVNGLVTGVGGSLATTADDSLFSAVTPFQVGSCGNLSFKPKLAFRLFGGTHRGSHPKLRATLTMPPGGANIASASVALPHSEFLDQGHIGTVCTRVQFAAKACPQASIYGTVSAKTPLLDETLTGPIYLRSSNHQLPDLVATFRGGRIDANLVGRVDSVNGGIRNTFDFVPDVPVTTASFNFFGGAKGLLVNSRNICKGTPKAKAIFNAQNGDQVILHPALKSACAKAKKSKRAAKRRHR
ncbi:MAG TPA: hypothetical protein VMR96_08370 [Solirubrobacterales bacterium]|nr:hypothetical protein [Solirubrobacterales bacterium]